MFVVFQINYLDSVLIIREVHQKDMKEFKTEFHVESTTGPASLGVRTAEFGERQDHFTAKLYVLL
jgi:hypothetical protein